MGYIDLPVVGGGGGPAITDLTGDVTAVGPGSAAATVDFVGGETAADVATSVQDTQAATDLSTPSTLVKRDAGGETSLDGLNLDGSTSGAINIKAADTTTNYTVKMPAAQGAASSVLENDGSGNLSWGTITIPPSANQTLSNLTSPTAINQNLNLGSNAISQTNYIISPQLYDAGTFAGAIALDWANGPAQKLVINAAGPLAITLSNPVTGGTYLLRLEQGATPGTVTWPGSVNWGTVGAPVLSNATGEVDIVSLFYDGTTYWASAQIQDALPAANYSLTNLSFSGSNEQVIALGSSGPYWATEGVKTGYPTNSVIVGKLKPGGFTSQQSIILGTGTTGNASTGLNNIMIGYNAAPALASGAGSIAIGSSTVIAAAISNGIAIGTSADCSGATSMAIGASAATGTGADNTIMGNAAGRSASTGANNTIIGRQAGDALTSGNANVFVGKQAGTEVTTGALNIFLGHTAGDAVTTGSNNTIIGDIAGSAALADTVIVAAGTAERFRIDSNGNMGLGTTAPNVRLDVQNTTAATNTVTNLLRLDSQSSGTPAAGIGAGIEMAAETAVGNTEVGVVLEAVTNDVTAASEDFDFVVKTMTAGAAATEKLKVGSNGSTTVANGDLILNTAGNGINIKEGTNARMGITDVFPTGNPNTVTVSTTEVTANSRIFLTAQTNPGGNPVELYISARNAGADFSITAHSNAFDGTVAWLIMEPA